RTPPGDPRRQRGLQRGPAPGRAADAPDASAQNRLMTFKGGHSMTWTGRILGSLLALVVVSGAAQGQPGTAPPAQGQPGTAPPAQGQPGTAPPAQGQPGTAPAAQGQPGTAPPVQVSEVTVDSTKITTI